MTEQPFFSVVGLLLAAGNSSRFGSPKQLAKVKSELLIQKTLNQFNASQVNEIYLVLGAYASQIKPQIPAHINVIEVSGWQEGMGTSIATAVKDIKLHQHENRPTLFSHVMIGLADQINLSTAGFNQLLTKAKQEPNKIIAAQYDNAYGAPCIFPRFCFEELAELQGEQGAKKLIKRHLQSVSLLPLPEAAIDIDTQAQLATWSKGK